MKKILRQYIEVFVLAILLAFLVRTFLVSAYRVTSVHMEPNLKVGDFIMASKWSTGWRIPFSGGKVLNPVWPKRGDIVLFSCPRKRGVTCVKRLVGLPGDRVEIVQGRLKVNNRMARYRPNPSPGRSRRGVQESLLGDQRLVLARLGGEDIQKVDQFGPIVVPPDHFFVLSDHRKDGVDSREWGSLPKSSLIGKASFIWLSLDWSRPIFGGSLPGIRTSRMFTGVD